MKIRSSADWLPQANKFENWLTSTIGDTLASALLPLFWTVLIYTTTFQLFRILPHWKRGVHGCRSIDFWARGVFEPEMITMMRDVFEDALRTLGLVDRQDPLTTMIAREVIELAQDGERDPDRLKQLPLEAFEGRPN